MIHTSSSSAIGYAIVAGIGVPWLIQGPPILVWGSRGFQFPGHDWVLHSCVSQVEPEQGFPPFDCGTSSLRLASLLPPPHVFEHCPSSQSLHLQSIGARKHKNVSLGLLWSVYNLVRLLLTIISDTFTYFDNLHGHKTSCKCLSRWFQNFHL